MEPTSKGIAPRKPVFVTILSMLLGVLVLSSCATVSKTPLVTSPANTLPPIVNQAPAAGAEQPAETVRVATEVAEADAVPNDDDTQPAEEVEPSPLDEIPPVAPPVSQSELEKNKSIVAEAAPVIDYPLVLNDQVAAYVEYFTHDHKELFGMGLVRSGRFVESFRRIFEEEGLPKDLVYMAHVESAFKTNAYSRAKAKGIFQFIAGTGRRYGLRIDSWIDERSDPEKSAHAAANYLKDLHGMFGDWYLALAAYNAGEGKVSRALASTKRNDFWGLASTRSLRAETKNYVPAILAATLIAKQPDKYGFDLKFDAPVTTDVVRIEGQTDLRVLARVADIDAEMLRQLNPQLRRGMTPPGSITEIRVPSGLGDAVSQAYTALSPSDRLVLARHHVEQGESLGTIAARYGVKSSDIATANRLGKGAAVRPGQEIVIPAVSAAPKDGERTWTNAGTYRVRKGDTLSNIAAHYRTTPKAIASASGISLHSNLSVGQRLKVPSKGGAAQSTVASSRKGRAGSSSSAARAATSPVVHTVRAGETLYRIAGFYQVTVNQICALNQITPNGVLYPGTRLKIRTN